MLYAWFSQKQIESIKRNKEMHKHGIYKVYLTEERKEVRASMVSNTKEHGCKFDDIKYLGMVEKFLRCEN
mgnify:FL=1